MMNRQKEKRHVSLIYNYMFLSSISNTTFIRIHTVVYFCLVCHRSESVVQCSYLSLDIFILDYSSLFSDIYLDN